jgi:hypothetical protein
LVPRSGGVGLRCAGPSSLPGALAGVKTAPVSPATTPTQAQAHSADGTRSTIVSQPGRPIGSTRAVLHSNPQTSVRAYEVEVVTAAGQHRYVVAIDINAAQHD